MYVDFEGSLASPLVWLIGLIVKLVERVKLSVVVSSLNAVFMC